MFPIKLKQNLPYPQLIGSFNDNNFLLKLAELQFYLQMCVHYNIPDVLVLVIESSVYSSCFTIQGVFCKDLALAQQFSYFFLALFPLLFVDQFRGLSLNSVNADMCELPILCVFLKAHTGRTQPILFVQTQFKTANGTLLCF